MLGNENRPTNRAMNELINNWRERVSTTGKKLSLEDFTDALNDVPYVAKIKRQTVHLWGVGRALPWPDRAARNLIVSPLGSWQREFWRDVLNVVAPEDEILGHPLAQLHATEPA